VRVVGGGVVVDAAPDVHRRFDAAALERVRHREEGEPSAILEKAIETAGAAGFAKTDADAALVATLASRGVVVAVAGRWFHQGVLAALAGRAVEMAAAHTSRHPLQWGIDKEELRRRLAFPHGAPVFQRVLDTVGPSHALFVREDRVRAGSAECTIPPPLERALESLNATVRAAGVAFPSREEAERLWSGAEPFADAVRWLREAGEWVDLGVGWMHREAFARSLDVTRGLFARQPSISVADFKDALGVSRKHAIPLLEYFDGLRVTLRRGDLRVPGPGLGTPDSAGTPP
jgi:selenocysteine-specific elongation factor